MRLLRTLLVVQNTFCHFKENMDKEGVLEFSKLNFKKNDPGIIGSDSLREKCLYSKLFSHSH